MEYERGQKIWTIGEDWGREKEPFKPDLVTVEYLERMQVAYRIGTGNEIPDARYYKLEEGCSYWRLEDELYLSKEEAQLKCDELNQQVANRRIVLKKLEELLRNLEVIKDGIYDISGLEFFDVDGNTAEDTIGWIENKLKNNIKLWKANAYETDTIFIFTELPKKFKGNIHGSGFNYGSTNILQNCPNDILVLAEND